MAMTKYDISKGLQWDYLPWEMPEGGLAQCKNVIPTTSQYVVMPSPVTLSSNGVSGTILNAVTVRRGRDVYTFIGTSTGLYKLETDTSLTLLSRPSGYSTASGERWSFAQYSDYLIATNYSDAVQVLKDVTTATTTVTITSAGTTATVTHTAHGYSTNDSVLIAGANEANYNGRFAVTVTGPDNYTYTMPGTAASPATGTITARRAFQNLGGSPPRARHALVCKGHVVLGYTVESSVVYQNRVRWSALESPEDWTAALATGADAQDVVDIEGTITGLVNYSDGFLIFAENTIQRATYAGYPYTFSLSEAIRGIGTMAPGSIVSTPNGVYFWSNDEIYLYGTSDDGTNVTGLGAGVRRNLFDKLNAQYQRWSVNAIHDPINKLIYWAYPTTYSATGQPDRILCYNYEAGKYSLIDTDAPAICYIQSSITIDNSTFLGYADDIPLLIDSRLFMPDNMVLAVLDASTGKVKVFLGAAMTAVIQPGEFNGGDNAVYLLRGVKPVVNRSFTSPSVRVGYRMNEADTPSYTTSRTCDSSGKANVLVSGKYLSPEITLTQHQGIGSLMIDTVKAGGR